MQYEEFFIDLKQQIGEGSEGKLYKCSDCQNKQVELCAKVVQVSDDQKEKQLDILSKLKNANCQNLVSIKFYTYSQSKQSIVIIMERCQLTLKNELEKRKQQNKSFSAQEIEDFLKQFLQGYQILYSHKILHRDIKPDNILINYENGKLIYKLTDFGISKVCDTNSMFITQIGTPIYAPPEYYADSELFNIKKEDDDFPQSKRDVYALGLILYQMITGQLPFDPTKSKKFINQIKDTPFIMQQSWNTNNQLKQLVEQMIQYYPMKRISIPQLIQQVQNTFVNLIPQQFPLQNNQLRMTINNQMNFSVQHQFGTINHEKVQDTDKNKKVNSCGQIQAPIPEQKFQTYSQISISVTIKQYIEEIINNYEFLIKYDELNKLKKVISQNSITEENAKILKSIFQFEKSKINTYNIQTLQFHCCLINYKESTIQFLHQKDVYKQYLNDQYQG